MTVSDSRLFRASCASAQLASQKLRIARRFWRVLAPTAMAAMLVWGNPSHAAPAGGPGGDPGPECAADITGSLTATPSSIDRETSLSPATTLAWSVVVPKGCPVPKLILGGRTVGTIWTDGSRGHQDDDLPSEVGQRE